MEDFQKLISEVEARHREYDSSKLRDEDVIFLLGVFLTWARQVVTRILGSLTTKTSLKVAVETASHLADNPSPENLAYLYSLYPDKRPLEFLVRLRIARKAMVEEIAKRFHPVGREIVRLEEKSEPNRGYLLSALRVERMTSYKPKKYSSEDLRDLAEEKAFKYYRDMIDKNALRVGDITVPPLPKELGLPTKDEPPLDKWYPYVLRDRTEYLLKIHLPFYKGKVDRVRTKVHQALRDFWEKWKAEKRIGEEVNLHEADKINLRRSPSGVWREKGERLKADSDKDFYLDAKPAYRILEKRYGMKGRMFLDGLKETGNVSEASKRAGITRQMGHRYKALIRESLPVRKT